MPEKTQIRFSDRTIDCGVQSIYRNGQEAGFAAIIEALGGGVAVVDYDRDENDDLFFAEGGGLGSGPMLFGRSSSLYRNCGEWRFINVSVTAEIQKTGHYSHGVISADYDSDGFVDVLITGFGGLCLWKNQGDGTFHDVTIEAGLNDSLWSSSAGWGDLNGDGSLDLYVVHYVDWSPVNHPRCVGPQPKLSDVCPPSGFNGLSDYVYFSNEDGTFREVSKFCELRDDGKGLAVLVCDPDRDGDLDIYVANDTVCNFLYENKGGGTFHEIGLSSATAFNDEGKPDGSMGVDILDFDLDGKLDFWVTNYENERSALYKNHGRLCFSHDSQRIGIKPLSFVGWGTCASDFDCDGDEDIFVANGHVLRFPANSPVRQPPLLYENRSGQRFDDVAMDAGDYMASFQMARGAATGDFDSDGHLDLVVSQINEPAAVLRNDTSNHNHWLKVELVGIHSSRDAIGATVTVTTSLGSRIRQWRGGGSYASTNARYLHFGLGAATIVQRLEIEWPSGRRQMLTSVNADQKLTIVER